MDLRDALVDWDEPDDEGSNTAHIAEHGLTPEEVESIASLPSREDLLSKVLFLINAQAQRLVTVLQAVPRNLAIVTEQVRAQKEAQGA